MNVQKRIVDIDVYMVGNGVFCKVTDLGDYASWEELHIDENGNVLTYDIKKSIIHSKYRLTYEDVNKLYNHELKMDDLDYQLLSLYP